jgi:putative ABC transport system permease protein
MPMFSRLLAILLGLVTRRRAERELAEELQFHLEMEIRANSGRGMSPAEARRVALRDLGGVTQTTESVRGVRSVWLDTLVRDVHLALRRIRRQPVISACIILLVALGVAVTSAVFSVADGVVFKRLPFSQSDQLVAFGGRPTRSEVPFLPVSPRQFWLVRESHLLSSVAVISQWSTSDTPEDVGLVGADVTPSLFEALRVSPLVGRSLADVDSTLADPRNVVIGYELWRSRFNGDASVVGRSVELGTRRAVVVGVMPRGFDFPNGSNIWAAAVLVPKPDYETYRYLQAVGRLRPGLTLRDAERELTTRIGYAVRAMPLRDWIRPQSSRALVLFVAGATLVLVLTWVEVAFLQLTRAASMHAELGLRLALGASRRQVLAQCVVEGCVLASAALVCAGLAASAMVSAVLRFLPPDVVRGQQIAVDVRVLAFASGVALLGVLAFALVPVHVVRGTYPGAALRGLGVEGKHRSPDRMRNVLLVAQIGLSCAMVYLGGLTFRSYREVDRVDLGFRPEGLLAVSLPRGADETQDATIQRFSQTVAAVQQLPGVRAASGTAFRPFARGAVLSRISRRDDRLEDAVAVTRSIVSPGFIRTVGGRLLAGRDFDDRDARGTPLVTILNETAARLLATDRELVGREILVDGLPYVVVGIARDMRMVRPDQPPQPLVYCPNAQWLAPSWLLARLDAMDPVLRERVRQTVGRFWTARRPDTVDVASDAERAAAPYRMRMQLLVLVAATGILLAAVGLYGGVMFVVRQRTREYAIRMALGAAPGSIQRSVAALSLKLVLSGVAAGLLAGGVSVRLMPEILFNVPAVDWTTAGAVAVIAAAVAVAAAALPARRAARIQPSEALRQE